MNFLDMLQVATQGTTGIVTIFFFGIMGILFIKNLPRLRNIHALGNELKLYRKKVTEVEKMYLNGEFNNSEDKPTEIYKVYKEYTDIKSKYISNNLDEYKKMLEIHNFTNVDAREYFNEDYLLDNFFNLQALGQVGPTLVGLGILGTFVGVSLGLIGAGEITTESVKILLNGMTTAFLTSVLGMTLSLFFTYQYKKQIGEVQRELNRVNNTHDKLFPASGDAESILGRIESMMRSFESKGVDMKITSDKNEKTLFGAFEAAGKKFADSTNSSFKGIADQFTMVARALEGSGQVIEGALKNNKDMYIHIDNVNQKIHELATSVGRIKEETNSVVEKINVSFDKQQNYFEEFKKNTDLIIGKLNEYEEKSTESFEKRAEALSNSIDETVGKLIEFDNVSSGKFKEREQVLNENVARTREYTKSLESNTAKLVEETGKISKELENNASRLEDVSDEIGNFQGKVAELNSVVREITSHSNNLVSTFGEKIDNFGEKSKVDETRRAEALREYEAKMADSLNHFATVMSKIITDLSELQEGKGGKR